MSDINSRGDFVHGVGGAFVNLNNVALFPGGVIGWMDDDTIACANGDANWTAFKYHVPTGTKTPLSDPLIGANSGYAGGGHAAWMWVPPPGSTDPHRGLNSTTGFTGVDLGVSGMGPNAEIAYKVFHSTGPHRVRELDGSEWELTPGDAYAVQLLGQGRALWLDYGKPGVFVRGIPQPRTRPGPIWFPRACFVQSRWWLGYQTPNDGTIAHPFDDPDHGYRFTPAGQDAWPMFRTLADGRLCCVWSNHIDEQAGRMTRVLKDVLTDPVESLDEPALPPLESVPLLNRKFGLACYCFNNTTSWGNLKVPIRPTEVIGIETPTIATIDDHAQVWDLDLWAIYSGEEPDVPIEESIAQARAVGTERKRGLTIYQDSYPMRDSVMALSEDGDILTPQVYRNADEDLASYRTRLRTAWIDGSIVRETWPTVNIHQRYSGEHPTLSVREVIEGFVTATQLAQEMSWPGMVLFRVGTSDVPDEVWPYVERFMSGITGRPEPRVLEDEEPEEPEEPDGMNVYLLVTPAVAPPANKVPPPGTTKLLGTRENQSDGSFAIKKPNGKYATLNPQAQWEERDAVLGAWEKFYDGKPGFILAPNRDNQCFTLQAVQGP